MNGRRADPRNLAGGQSTLRLDNLERGRVPWLLGQEVANLVEQVMAQGVDVTTLQIEARRDGSNPHHAVRVSARLLPT